MFMSSLYTDVKLETSQSQMSIQRWTDKQTCCVPPVEHRLAVKWKLPTERPAEWESLKEHAEWASETQTVHAVGFHFCEVPEQVNKYSNSKNVAFILSLVAQQQRIRLPMQETRVQSLGREYPLEKEMATRSRIFAWEIPWTEEPGGLAATKRTERLNNNLKADQWLSAAGICKGQKRTFLGWQTCPTSWLWWWLHWYIICPNSLNNF